MITEVSYNTARRLESCGVPISPEWRPGRNATCAVCERMILTARYSHFPNICKNCFDYYREFIADTDLWATYDDTFVCQLKDQRLHGIPDYDGDGNYRPVNEPDVIQHTDVGHFTPVLSPIPLVGVNAAPTSR